MSHKKFSSKFIPTVMKILWRIPSDLHKKKYTDEKDNSDPDGRHSYNSL